MLAIMAQHEKEPASGGLPFDEVFTEVRYGETDQMGFAHHAVAVLWLELGRVCWLRKHGLSYRKLERDGLLLPVVEMNIRYHAPGHFEDQIVIQTRPAEISKTRIVFESKVLRVEPEKAGRTLLITGNVVLVCLTKERRVCRVPPVLEELWAEVHRGSH
jgi:acyl-CoA thioester hydrolase